MRTRRCVLNPDVPLDGRAILAHGVGSSKAKVRGARAE